MTGPRVPRRRDRRSRLSIPTTRRVTRPRSVGRLRGAVGRGTDPAQMRISHAPRARCRTDPSIAAERTRAAQQKYGRNGMTEREAAGSAPETGPDLSAANRCQRRERVSRPIPGSHRARCRWSCGGHLRAPATTPRRHRQEAAIHDPTAASFSYSPGAPQRMSPPPRQTHLPASCTCSMAVLPPAT